MMMTWKNFFLLFFFGIELGGSFEFPSRNHQAKAAYVLKLECAAVFSLLEFQLRERLRRRAKNGRVWKILTGSVYAVEGGPGAVRPTHLHVIITGKTAVIAGPEPGHSHAGPRNGAGEKSQFNNSGPGISRKESPLPPAGRG